MIALDRPTAGVARLAGIAVAGALVAAVAAPSASSAQDFDRAMVRSHVSAIFLDAEAPVLGVELENTVTAGLDITVFANRNVAFNALAAFIAPEAILLTGEGEASLGTVNALPPAVTVQYHFLPDGKVRPYLGAGGSWVHVFNESGALEDINAEVEDGLGLVGQAGFNGFVAPGVALFADFRWVEILNDPELTTDLGNDEFDFRHFILSGGIGFTF